MAARIAIAAGILVACNLGPAWPCLAAEDASTVPRPLQREVWIGADVTASSWLVYSGVTLSPLSGIHDDGPRLRFATGYGGYRWQGASRAMNGTVAHGAGTAIHADALIGYLKRMGPLTAKVFGGASLAGHAVTDLVQPLGLPVAPGDEPLDGREIGLKVSVELWLNIGARGWSSLDVNWTSAHDTYAARFRAAWRAWPTISLGVEAIANGDRRHDIAAFASAPGLEHLEKRIGAFARYEWYGGEVSLAGGIASAPDADTVTPYATLNWITQF